MVHLFPFGTRTVYLSEPEIAKPLETVTNSAAPVNVRVILSLILDLLFFHGAASAQARLLDKGIGGEAGRWVAALPAGA
jgi:hypothetical protein